MKIALALLLLAALVAAAHFSGIRVEDVRAWIQALGPAGPAAFVLVYVAAVVAAVPGSAITVLAGALFGSVLGVALVSVASTVGASLAFLIARYVARDAVARRFQDNDRFRRLDQLTERHGAIMVAIARLVPLFPFNLVNYGFGLTRVPFWTYVLWSWLCMLPGTVLYVVGTDAVVEGWRSGRVPWMLVGVVAAAVALLAVAATRLRRRIA